MNQNATASDGWFKSSLSFANGNCVEAQFLTDGGVQVRNSRSRDTVVTFTADEWECFLGGVRNGEFDLFGQTPSDSDGCTSPEADGDGSSPGISGPLTCSNQA